MWPCPRTWGTRILWYIGRQTSGPGRNSHYEAKTRGELHVDGGYRWSCYVALRCGLPASAKGDGKMKGWVTSGLESDFIHALYLVSEPENMLRVSAKPRPYGSLRSFRGAAQCRAFLYGLHHWAPCPCPEYKLSETNKRKVKYISSSSS